MKVWARNLAHCVRLSSGAKHTFVFSLRFDSSSCSRQSVNLIAFCSYSSELSGLTWIRHLNYFNDDASMLTSIVEFSKDRLVLFTWTKLSSQKTAHDSNLFIFRAKLRAVTYDTSEFFYVFSNVHHCLLNFLKSSQKSFRGISSTWPFVLLWSFFEFLEISRTGLESSICSLRQWNKQKILQWNQNKFTGYSI